MLLKHSKPLPFPWLLIVIQLFLLPQWDAQFLRGRHCLGTTAGQIMSNTYQIYFGLQVQRLVVEVNGHILNVHFVISHPPTHILWFYYHNNPILLILLFYFTESEFKPWEMSYIQEANLKLRRVGLHLEPLHFHFTLLFFKTNLCLRHIYHYLVPEHFFSWQMETVYPLLYLMWKLTQPCTI